MKLYRQALLLMAITCFPLTALAAKFSGLVDRIPAHANTLILINVDQLHATPLAKEEGWREDHNRQFEAGFTMVPPESSRVVLASNTDLEFFQPIWDAAIVEVDYDVSIPKFASKRGGTVDKIEGRDAAVLADDTYVVKFGPKLVGAMSPANRQLATRWLRFAYADSDKKVSPYLKEAIHYADNVGTPIIMAIDLDNALSPGAVRARLDSLESLKDIDVDVDKLVAGISSARGATLGVTVKERAYGKLKIDFGQEVPLDPEHAKALILEVLAHRGAMIDEMYEWTPEVNGKQISLEGPLYASGLRRLSSVLEPPEALQEARQQAAEQTPEEANESLVVVSSQHYFKSVVSLTDDLRDKSPSGGFKTAGQKGMWYGKYAKKIDRLPMANVDTELLDFGSYVSSALRGAQQSMQSVGAQTRAREVNVRVPEQYVNSAWTGNRWGRYGAYGGGGWYGGYTTEYYTPQEERNMQQRELTTIRTEERVRGYGEANNIMVEVDNATADIRRRMTEKYQVDF